MSSIISAERRIYFGPARAVGSPAAESKNFYPAGVAVPTLEEIGKRIGEWREERGINQGKLGALIGRSPRTVSSMESGKVTLEMLLKTMQQLEKDFGDLASEPAEKRPEASRSDPRPDPRAIPLEEHRAVLWALGKAKERIEALEQLGAGDPTPENIDRLEDDAAGGDATRQDEPPGGGSGRSKGRGRGRRKPKS